MDWRVGLSSSEFLALERGRRMVHWPARRGDNAMYYLRDTTQADSSEPVERDWRRVGLARTD